MKFVPQYRLMICVGAVYLPMAVISTLIPGMIEISLTLVAAVVILALIDMILTRDHLSGITVLMPDVVRLSKGREGDITVTIENKRSPAGKIRIGFAFPKEIATLDHDITVVLHGQDMTSTFKWPVKGEKHGRYVLDEYYLETSSPLGFWAIRTAKSTHFEIRVYPNLFLERRNLTGLFLNRGVGIHSQRQIGKGRDFEQLREYLPGDSYEDIHWKATAKRGQPITKVYQIERTQQIYVIIDASRLSARTTHVKNSKIKQSSGHEENTDFEPTTIVERYITAALIMALAAERQGDQFGLITFDNRVQSFVSAKNGKAHFNTCRDILYTLEPKTVSPDFTELFTFIGTRIRRRALLLFLTHLDDPVLSENFSQNIDIISRQHLVLVNMLKPEGAAPVFSSASVESIDDMYKNLGGHLVWKHLHETEKILYRHGVDFSWVENEHLCTEIISKYISIKQRQIL